MAELIGIIHDGSEEVGTLKENPTVTQAECSCIVGLVKSDEDPIVRRIPRQFAQNLGQVLRTQLAGSTRSVTQLC